MKRSLVIVALLGSVQPCLSEEAKLPSLKSGKWDVQTTSSGGAGVTTRKTVICVDEQTQRQMFEIGSGMSKQLCSSSELKKVDDSYVRTSTCSISGRTLISESTTKFNGDNSYRAEINSSTQHPSGDKSSVKIVVEGNYSGSCPADMKPGDIIMPDGKKMNVEMMREDAASRLKSIKEKNGL